MRMDLNSNAHRNPLLQLALAGVRLYLGALPGPMPFMSWRLAFFHKEMPAYGNRSMSGAGSWSRGEAELLFTFASKLNQCHF